MKKLVFITLLAFLFGTAGAQTTDYLQKKEFQTEKKKIYDNIDAAKKPSSELKKLVSKQSLKIDSLANLVKSFGTQTARFNDSINKMSATVASLSDQLDSSRQKTWKSIIQVIVMLAIILLLGLVAFFILWRKIKTNFEVLNEHSELINEKIDKQTGAIRIEVIEGVAKMQAIAEEMNQKFANRFDQFEAQHGQVHMKIQDYTSSLKEELEGIRVSSEEKFQTFKSALAVKADELLAQTKAIKSQVEKDIQVLSSELKKVRPV
jgi:hypothetical protein